MPLGGGGSPRGGRMEEIPCGTSSALMRLIESPAPSLERAMDIPRLSNLHLLTALRRVQKKPDPLRILVAGKLKRGYSLQEKPRFTLLLTNLDEEKQPVTGFTVGGDYRTGRLARWRFEVRDEKGRLLPIIGPGLLMGGGLGHWETLEYGESWKAELPLESYVHISAPGKYTLRVFYHNREEIVDRQDISDLLTSHSPDIALEVAPISVSVTDEQRRNARKWISQLPDAGPVRMAIGGIVECKDFLDPDSPAGRLQRMYNSALPDLIDGALDPSLKPGQRAWVLGLLFAITGHNDPRGVPDDLSAGRELLGSYEYTGGRGMGSTRLWVADSYEYSSEAGSGSFRGGKINPEKQRAFAEKWRVWKTNGYYTLQKR